MAENPELGQTKIFLATFLIKSGVPQGSIIGPLLLYILYTKEMSTFADDTVSPATDGRSRDSFCNSTNTWLYKWRIKINETKFAQVTFTPRRDQCPPILLNKKHIAQSPSAKYLGALHIGYQ